MSDERLECDECYFEWRGPDGEPCPKCALATARTEAAEARAELEVAKRAQRLIADVMVAELSTARGLLGRFMVWASGVAFKSLYGEQAVADTGAFLAPAHPVPPNEPGGRARDAANAHRCGCYDRIVAGHECEVSRAFFAPSSPVPPTAREQFGERRDGYPLRCMRGCGALNEKGEGNYFCRPCFLLSPMKEWKSAARRWDGAPAVHVVAPPGVPNRMEAYMMRHALGGNKGGRNYYCATNDGEDAKGWRNLVAAGFATVTRVINDGRDTIFTVTEAGKKYLTATAEHVPGVPPPLQPAGMGAWRLGENDVHAAHVPDAPAYIETGTGPAPVDGFTHDELVRMLNNLTPAGEMRPEAPSPNSTTDLERELLEAADAYDHLASANPVWSNMYSAHAARLRARAAHIHAMEVGPHETGQWIFEALTGPVPVKTEGP